MNPFGHLALALSKTNGPAKGIDEAVGIMNAVNIGLIPDCDVFRKALAAWGIAIKGKGDNISKMIGSERTMKVDLPNGWEARPHGIAGHNALFDNSGATRLRWHIHPWDPIATWVENRYSIRTEDLSVSKVVYRILDGAVVIHTFPFEYPHARTIADREGGRTYYNQPEDRQQSRANYMAGEAAQEMASKWLDENRPGCRDALKSWSID